MNKTLTLSIALIGLALGTALVIWLGAGHIFQAILKIGWLGLAYVLAWQLFVFVILGLGWWILCPGAAPWVLVWGRLVREGSEMCLPFSEIGGLIFGARAIMLAGVDFAHAGASSIADVICEGIALAPFLLFGLVMLLTRHAGALLYLFMGLGLGLLVAGGAAAFLMRRWIGRLMRKAAEKFLAKWIKDAPDHADELQQAFNKLFQQHLRIAGSSAIHVLCWCGGGGNVWIAYHLLGARPSILDALAIESILSGVLAIGFLVPAGFGVQELTYIGVGRLFGLPAHLSLALSLIRRARDIIIGAPALLAWQGLEARRLKKH